MHFVFKEGPDVSVNEAVVAEVNSIHVESFKVIPYGEEENDKTPVLIAEDKYGAEAARLTDFDDADALTDFLWNWL